MIMRTIWNNLLHLFFPRLCALCKEPLIEGEEQICLKCLCDLPHTDYLYEDDNPVFRLFIGKAYIEKATAFLRYEKGGGVQQLILAFKYYGNRDLAYRMGRKFALALQSHAGYTHADFLIPVPLHPRKKRQRGYNQSEWICRGMASVWHIPVNTSVLKRKTFTLTQTYKTFFNRWRNVRETFVLSDPTILQGKHLILVDDVITSGSTIAECAARLLTIPRVRVSVLALAAT
jgi:ComF family protein